jgi:hypothetical protein
MSAPEYLKRISSLADIPGGMVVVHNHVRPTRQLSMRGFGAWVQVRDDELRELCPCSWAHELPVHYRIRAERLGRKA